LTHSRVSLYCSLNSSMAQAVPVGQDVMQSLHSQAAQQSGVSAKDLLAVSRAKANVQNLAIALDSQSSAELSAIQWADLVTLAHAEVLWISFPN
jgi:hypothetical protein